MVEINKKLRKNLFDIINSMSSIVEINDPYTAGHQLAVAEIALAISKNLKLRKKMKEGIRSAAIMHDIGKLVIPSSILNKPEKLSKLEFSLIKTHPQKGCEILKNIDFPWPINNIILQHHERENGSGYPKGLKSKDIMLEAKILAVADVVEAMSSDRPYRQALGLEIALEEIEKNKGKLYDSEVVEACLKVYKK